MSRQIAIICEGKTEELFCHQLIAPYMILEGITVRPMQISKPGQKGGDVKYARLRNDLKNLLHQPHWSCVTTFFDFYGLQGEWSGYVEAQGLYKHTEKYERLTSAVREQVRADLSMDTSRFLPNFVMYETEGLYFSDSAKLATGLGVSQADVDIILQECGEPEAINNSQQTAPSKRLSSLLGRQFEEKTTTGITIAKSITLPVIMEQCPIFKKWIDGMISLCAENH